MNITVTMSTHPIYSLTNDRGSVGAATLADREGEREREREREREVSESTAPIYLSSSKKTDRAFPLSGTCNRADKSAARASNGRNSITRHPGNKAINDDHYDKSTRGCKKKATLNYSSA